MSLPSLLSRLTTPFLTSPLRILGAVPSRSVGNRQRLYGEEEGHGVKGEVRKIKWIRKHMGPRTRGEAWRSRHAGLPPMDPFKAHSFVTRPDWSYADGSPGHLNPGQVEAVANMTQLCKEVKAALDHVNKKV